MDSASMDHEPQAYLSEIFVSAQGEGARVGQRHLFVRFAGCNIRCVYCDTPDSLVRVQSCEISYPCGETVIRDNPISVVDLAAVVERCCDEDPQISMIALTGGEPMVQQRFLNVWLADSPPPVGCLLETNATIVQGLETLMGKLAVVSADVKLPSNSGEAPFWERHCEFLRVCRGTETYVKMPISDDTDLEEVSRGARLVADCSPRATLFLQPVTDERTGRWRIGHSRLFASLSTASAQNARSMFRPQLHKLMGIR
jgi:organic radical activating enzyme